MAVLLTGVVACGDASSPASSTDARATSPESGTVVDAGRADGHGRDSASEATRPHGDTGSPVGETGPGESASCSQVTGTNGALRDASGNVWTLRQGDAAGLVVYENGAAAGFTSAVIALAYVNHVVSQENDAHSWWSWTGSAWSHEADPTGSCPGSVQRDGGTEAGPAGDAGAGGYVATTVYPNGSKPAYGTGGTNLQAYRINDFLNSIGVNSNGWNEDVAHATTALNYVGFKHVRGLPNVQPGFTYVADERALSVGTGVRWDMLTTPPGNFMTTESAAQQVQDCLSMGEYCESIEGVNEPSTSGVDNYQYNGVGVPASVRNWQSDLWIASQGEPAFAGKWVFGPSLIQPPNFGSFSNLGGSAGFSNMHLYNGTQYLGLSGNQEATAVDEPNAYQPNPPAVTTEFGNVINGCLQNQFGGGVDDVTAAHLYGADFLDMWVLGEARTFIYCIRDTGTYANPCDNSYPGAVENYFGLFDSNWQPKAHATMFHYLTEILADQGARANSFTPGTLTYSLGGSVPAHTFSTLFENSAGEFIVAIWTENTGLWTSGSNGTYGHLKVTTPQEATLSLGRSFTSIALYDPVCGTTPAASCYGESGSTTPASTGTGSTFIVPLTDHAVFVFLTP